MALRVYDIIKRGYLDECILLGGENGLSREIKLVSVVELPNAHLWCKGGELLLTALYSIKNCEEAQINLLENMNKNGAAAMIIFNYESCFDNISEKLIERADDLAFPIFKAPSNLTYGEIIKPITEDLIFDKYEKEMPSFFDSIISGVYNKKDSLGNVSKLLSQKLGCSIAILDHNFGIIEGSLDNDTISRLDGGLFDKYINKYKTGNYEVISDNIICLDKDKEGLITLLSYIKDGKGSTIGYLLFFSKTNKILNKSKLYLMSVASLAYTIQLQSRLEIQAMEAKYENNFVINLLNGKIASGYEIMERGKLVNIDMNNRYFILVIKTNNTRFEESLYNRLYGNIKQNNLNNIVIRRFEEIIVIPYIESAKEDIIIDKRKQIGHDILHNIKNDVLNNLAIGAGNYYFNLESLHNSYKEAKKAIALYEMISSKFNYSTEVPIVHYENVENFVILEHICQNAEFKAYSNNMFDPIKKYDRDNNTELLKTMLTYFLTGLNINDTANRLFVHKNTVNYRLLKIKNLLGEDPFEAGNFTKYCIATLMQVFL